VQALQHKVNLRVAGTAHTSVLKVQTREKVPRLKKVDEKARKDTGVKQTMMANFVNKDLAKKLKDHVPKQ
jgi:hypothetical protein